MPAKRQPSRAAGATHNDDDVVDAEVVEGDTTRWVTQRVAAAEAGVSLSAVHKWYKADKVPHRKVPGPHGLQVEVDLDACITRGAEWREATKGTLREKPAATNLPAVFGDDLSRLQEFIGGFAQLSQNHARSLELVEAERRRTTELQQELRAQAEAVGEALAAARRTHDLEAALAAKEAQLRDAVAELAVAKAQLAAEAETRVALELLSPALVDAVVGSSRI